MGCGMIRNNAEYFTKGQMGGRCVMDGVDPHVNPEWCRHGKYVFTKITQTKRFKIIVIQNCIGFYNAQRVFVYC